MQQFSEHTEISTCQFSEHAENFNMLFYSFQHSFSICFHMSRKEQSKVRTQLNVKL